MTATATRTGSAADYLLALDSAWAIESNFASGALALLARLDWGEHLAQNDPIRRKEKEDVVRDRDDPTLDYTLWGGVASISISGPLTKKPTSLQSALGGTSTVLARKAIRQAAADPAVGAMKVTFDTPGGQVSGIDDLAADLRAASAVMPVAAYCEDTCASGGYWAACCCSYGVFSNQGANVGSIGVLALMKDTSRAYANAGVAVHVIGSGELKGMGADGAPVTSQQLAEMQSYVDRSANLFYSTVAGTRSKMTPEQMQDIKRAGIYIGQEAVGVGLVDAIMGADELQSNLQALAKATLAARAWRG